MWQRNALMSFTVLTLTAGGVALAANAAESQSTVNSAPPNSRFRAPWVLARGPVWQPLLLVRILKVRRAVNVDRRGHRDRLQTRRIKAIVFDPVIPRHHYQWDGIHITAEGQAMFASKLLPLVIAAINEGQ